MKKIPTLFLRDPENMRRLLPQVHPDCEWVMRGEGAPTRKYDGTCTMLDEDGLWWARREIKRGASEPPGFVPIQTDNATGKTVGWEPVAQSSFAKAFRTVSDMPDRPGTYELCGPKINGNPEKFGEHILIPHATAQVYYLAEPYTFESLRTSLTSLEFIYEGIVWHHPDGRMAKLKRRDFGIGRLNG